MNVRHLIAIGFAFTALAGSYCQAGDDELKPYLEGTEHTISEREYDDLKSYVERAQKILERTIEDSTAFAGSELRDHYLHGIQLALENTDLRGELLLFRYVLVRAVKLDQMYVRGYDTANGHTLSAQVLLRPAIESALRYYQSSDLPRLATTTVPSPDWTAFAADQIPYLLAAVDWAPSKTKKAWVARAAVGWTARALNSAHERRGKDVAQHIVRLGELYNGANLKHPLYVRRAQDELLTVYKAFRKPLQTIRVIPASKGDDLKMRDRAWYKRLGSGVKGVGGDVLDAFPLKLVSRKDPIYKEWNTGEYAHHGITSRINVELGLGIGSSYDGNDAGDVRHSKAISLDVDLALGGLTIEGPGALSGHVKGYVVPDGNIKDWTYSVRAGGGGAFFAVLGVYGLIETNKFHNLEETLLRFGWGPQGIIRMGKGEYVLIRGLLGGAVTYCDTEQTNAGACYDRAMDFSLGGGVELRKTRFAASLDGIYNKGVGGDESPGGRYGVDADVTLPLNWVIRNDALSIKGKVVSYDNGGPKNGTLLFFYGLNW